MDNIAVICGALSIVSIFIPGVGLGVSTITAIIAIVLGGKVKKEPGSETKGKIAIGLGIGGLLVMIGVFVFTFFLISQLM
ncbi:MAG: hypothetical protein R3Y53_09980 [Bacillota bacterium]